MKLKCLYVYLAEGVDYSSVTLITRCQQKVDVTNQCNFNSNATLQWWISQRRTTKSRLNIMKLILDYIQSYFPHGNSAFGTSQENVTHSLFWHWFFLGENNWEKKNSYVNWFSLWSLGKSVWWWWAHEMTNISHLSF